MLILQVILAEAQFYILEIREQHKEEFQSWIHRELSEQNRRGAKREAQANLSDLELLDVDLLDVSLRLHVRLAFLFQFVEGTLHLCDFVANGGEKVRLLDGRWVRSDLITEENLLRFISRKLGLLSEF